MSTTNQRPWQRILADLAAWHASRDRLAANRALTHIESFLRTRIPPIARRRWSADEIDDALQGFLERLLNKPLPPELRKPEAYLGKAFRRWCIDRQRGRKADVHEPWDDAVPDQTTRQDPELRERLERAARALDALRMEDRVVIKLVDVPHSLTWEELSWLGSRCGRSAADVQEQVLAAPEVIELSLIFDPGDPPATAKERRDRMERFRRRRSRARERLRELMGGEP